MTRQAGDRRRPLLAVLAAALALSALLAADVARAAAPTAPDELVRAVRTALQGHDLAAFDELVNWEGASKYRQRMVKFQLRYTFGRPIRSIALEPFPADGFKELEARGTLKPNMAVTERLRVVFDEPASEAGRTPTAFFLVGREGEGYRIALVVPARPPGRN